MSFKKKLLTLAIASSAAINASEVMAGKNFARIASFPVCSQIHPTCDTNEETAAEIVAASEDGLTLVYSDSPGENLGFVNISNPNTPVASGTVSLSGEPTSVAVKGDFALVGINTSADFVNVSGQLDVINMNTRATVASLPLGGQPDSVAVSPDKTFAVVVIENERDEDLGNGEPPQAPAGQVIIVNIADANPANWTTTPVDITGYADLYSGDPEPEYVDINSDNIAAITLQENNHLMLIDLATATIINHFSAGTVDLTAIDTEEEDPAIISLTESQDNVPREPDGVTWIGNKYFATADEGDLNGGSRGFTIFKANTGKVVYSSGNDLDHMTVKYGHYPDARSGNKGNEPENVEYGEFDGRKLLFVNSERSSLVFVYDVENPKKPNFRQVLPAGVGPEGGLAIPSRNLLVVASEEDARDDKIRSVLNIYEFGDHPANYPTLESSNRETGDAAGTPIPWSAISGLSADPNEDGVLYAVDDSFYGSNRIFKILTKMSPANIYEEIYIKDSNNVFANFPTSGPAEDPNTFDAVDLANMINADKTVNIDSEGISASIDGGFWVASEGAGTIGDAGRPIEKLNFIFKTDPNGVIEKVISLPTEVNAIQLRFGFEGVAEYNGKVYVAFQRAWNGEANPRLGIYNTTTQTWSFVYYPLDTRESQNNGWVGLSDITSLGNEQFLVVERDNQGGPDAAIKRLYKIDLSTATEGQTITKTLVRDLMNDLSATGGLIPEKIEGSAVMSNGDVYIVNDNDGVDDNSGETQLLNLGNIL